MSLQNIAEVISRTAVLALAKGELHSLSLVYTHLRKSQAKLPNYAFYQLPNHKLNRSKTR